MHLCRKRRDGLRLGRGSKREGSKRTKGRKEKGDRERRRKRETWGINLGKREKHTVDGEEDRGRRERVKGYNRKKNEEEGKRRKRKTKNKGEEMEGNNKRGHFENMFVSLEIKTDDMRAET